MLNPRRNGVVSTFYLPNLVEQDKPFSYETVQAQDKYYTHLHFGTTIRPTSLTKLFSPPYQIEPKPWSRLATDLYYKLEGEFVEGENYWSGGSLSLSDSVLDLKVKFQTKLTDSEVIAKLENLICSENSPGDWSHEAHRATLLKEHIPLHLKNKTTKIVRELDYLFRSYLSLTLQEAEQRFCIVINGDSGFQKTTLATELIIPKLAASNVIRSKHSYVMGEEQDLTDKLERIDNKEVVVLDDYSGENHKLGVLNKLTSSSQVSSIRVMGDYQSTRYVKGVIIPTVDSIETWITNKTGTLRKFTQILRRTNCTLYIFASKHISSPTWEDFKDRLFYVGNVREGIYSTVKEHLPHLVDEPLGLNHRDTQLAKDLAKLYHLVVNALYRDKKYGDSEYFDRSKVPSQFWGHCPDTSLGTEPNIIRMFKLPDYEWLREKVNSLDNEDLRLPFLESSVTEETDPSPTPPSQLNRPSYTLDIETSPFEDSPLKQLMLRSVQLDDQFLLPTKENLPILKKELRNKELIVFNSPFEQTQLYRQGFDIWSNSWVDVSLLAKLADNRLAEEKLESLADLEERFLRTTSKKRKVQELNAKYKGADKSFLKHPYIAEDPLFQEYGVNDTKITKQLYDTLIGRVDQKLFRTLQTLQDKLAEGQMEGIPFPRERITTTLQRIQAARASLFNQIVDLTVGTKSKDQNKGGNSSKLVTDYIRKYKLEGVPYLKPPSRLSKNLCFNSKAKERLMENFPEDRTLQLAYGIKKRERAIQQYTKLLQYADGDKLYPNYIMLGAASGRFISRQPEFHNLLAKPLSFLEHPEDYDVRTTLLGAANVFEVDFSNQEARYMAGQTGEPSMIKAYLKGVDLADQVSKDLKIGRKQAKTILYGLPYGTGSKRLKTELGISYDKAQQIYDSFGDKYPRIKEYGEELESKDQLQSPLLGRVIQFSKYKTYTKFNWSVQGGCADLLFIALEHILDSEKVELRGHFHDGLILACLCSGSHPHCLAAEHFKRELEDLYSFTGPETNEKVFKFGEVRGVS